MLNVSWIRRFTMLGGMMVYTLGGTGAPPFCDPDRVWLLRGSEVLQDGAFGRFGQ